MPLPPGPAYLLRLIPYFVFPSAVTYAFLKLLQSHIALPLPSWLIISVSILSRPILLLIQTKSSNWMDRKAAAACGAVLAPFMEESPLDVISEFVAAFDGYPGPIFVFFLSCVGEADAHMYVQATLCSGGQRNMATQFNFGS